MAEHADLLLADRFDSAGAARGKIVFAINDAGHRDAAGSQQQGKAHQYD